MQKLVKGIRQFHKGIFSSKQRLFEGPVENQHILESLCSAENVYRGCSKQIAKSF